MKRKKEEIFTRKKIMILNLIRSKKKNEFLKMDVCSSRWNKIEYFTLVVIENESTRAKLCFSFIYSGGSEK